MKRRLVHMMLAVRLWWLENQISPHFDSALSRAIDKLLARLDDKEVQR